MMAGVCVSTYWSPSLIQRTRLRNRCVSTKQDEDGRFSYNGDHITPHPSHDTFPKLTNVISAGKVTIICDRTRQQVIEDPRVCEKMP